MLLIAGLNPGVVGKQQEQMLDGEVLQARGLQHLWEISADKALLPAEPLQLVVLQDSNNQALVVSSHSGANPE